jgi:hypothetical protein
MKAILVILSLSVMFFGCSKDKVETKPHLSLKSANPKVVPLNNDMIVNMDFTDEEGDLDGVYMWKIRLNRIKLTTVRDSLFLTIPEFPKNNTGQLELLLEYQRHLISATNPRRDPLSGKLESDTLNMKFVLKDRAGNTSDTVYLNNVVILRDQP